MKFGKQTTTFVLCCVSGLILIAIICSPAVRTRYHLWRLETDYRSLRTMTQADATAFVRMQSYECQLDQLASLGYLSKRYCSVSKACQMEAGLTIVDALLGDALQSSVRATRFARTTDHAGDGTGEDVVVWDYKPNMQGWTAFFASIDDSMDGILKSPTKWDELLRSAPR